jgi:signal transduction histidine kinase
MARRLVGARYAALALFDEQNVIRRFITDGLSEEERAALGELPRGHGLLGAVWEQGGPVRSEDIAHDPRRAGFPPGHPPMTTFVGVPILSRDQTIGTLYLTDKLQDGVVLPFDDADEAFLVLIASQIGVAAENARLHATAQGLATLAERERIARELHDNLAQVLGYIRLQAGGVASAIGGGQTAEALRLVGTIDAAVAEAYADVREAILGLRSHAGAERDLARGLQRYVTLYQRQTGLPVTLDTSDDLTELPLVPMAEAQLLRIIQEALNNSRKHSGCSRVSLRLAPDGTGGERHLVAVIEDDGRGFDPQQPGTGLRFGLVSMRERAHEVGGSLRIDSAPGRGTRVTVRLPLQAVRPPAADQGTAAP